MYKKINKISHYSLFFLYFFTLYTIEKGVGECIKLAIKTDILVFQLDVVF